MKLKASLLFCGISLIALGSDDRFWEKQDSAKWTPAQVTQFTTASPWAKQVTATLISNDSNMAGGAPRTTGGGGRRGGGIISSRGNSSSQTEPGIPKFQAMVRWVSAQPMLQLMKVKLPENLKGRYVISVTGLPIGGDTTAMAEQTTLQLKRNEPVHPETVYQDPDDTATVYCSFLPSMVDLSSAKTAEFKLTAAPFEVRAKFNLSEMKIHGDPAF